MEHTPTPWIKDHRSSLRGSNGKQIVLYGLDAALALTPCDETRANAEFVIKAVNAHAKLVAALKEMVAFGEEVERNHLVGDEGCFWSVEKARAALREAGEL